MLGMQRDTGRSISGFDQFVSRVVQVMTTPLGTREHRRTVGSRLHETLAQGTGDDMLMKVQAYALEAFYNQDNGLGDFTPDRVVATRTATGVVLRFSGEWKSRNVTFEVTLC